MKVHRRHPTTKDKTEISVLYSSGGFQDGFFNPPSSSSRLCGRLTKHSDCPHGRPGDADDRGLIQKWLLILCLAKSARHFAIWILHFYFVFCFLHFVFFTLYFQFWILLFTFCIFHFVFCILYFSGCFLGRYDAAAKDEEADWRAGNHFWGVNVNLIRSTYRWKIFQI